MSDLGELGVYTRKAIESAGENIGTPKCPDTLKDFAYQMFLSHPDITIELIRFMWNGIQECDE